MQNYHHAQINDARMRASLDDPIMAEFKTAIDEINANAERSPGFVWRVQNESGDATEIRVYDDPKILVNMSVWQSTPQLKDYVYGSLHKDFFMRRRQWFEKFQGAHFGRWWLTVFKFPSATIVREKIEYLTIHGESPECFAFKNLYSAPTKESVIAT